MLNLLKDASMEFEGQDFSDVLEIVYGNPSIMMVHSRHSIGTVSIAATLLANRFKCCVGINIRGATWVVQPGDPHRLLAQRWYSYIEGVPIEEQR